MEGFPQECCGQAKFPRRKNQTKKSEIGVEMVHRLLVRTKRYFIEAFVEPKQRMNKALAFREHKKF